MRIIVNDAAIGGARSDGSADGRERAPRNRRFFPRGHGSLLDAGFHPAVREAPGGQVAAVKFRFDGWARYDNHQQGRSRRATRGGVALARFVADGAPHDGTREARRARGRRHRRRRRRARCSRRRIAWSAARTAEIRGSAPRARSACSRDYLGVEKVIWVGAGVVGDDTAGHVDDFVRFTAPGQVLLAEEKNPRDPNHGLSRRAANDSKAARDAKGRRLEIVRVPMPAPVMWGDERLPASYANYYVANGLVLVPTFDDPNDRVALGILGELFPTRRIVGMRARRARARPRDDSLQHARRTAPATRLQQAVADQRLGPLACRRSLVTARH